MKILNNKDNIDLIEKYFGKTELRGNEYLYNIIITKSDGTSTKIQLEDDNLKSKPTNILGIITQMNTETKYSSNNYAILLKEEKSFNRILNKYTKNSSISGYYILKENDIMYTLNFEIDYDTIQYILDIKLKSNHELIKQGNVMNKNILELTNRIDSYLEYIGLLNDESLIENLESLKEIITIQENLYVHFNLLIRSMIIEFKDFLSNNFTEPRKAGMLVKFKK